MPRFDGYVTSPKVSRALTKTDSRFLGQVWSPAVKCTLFFPYSELGREDIIVFYCIGKAS